MILFFGGAGVSTESEIPDFHSSKSLYSKNNRRHYPTGTLMFEDSIGNVLTKLQNS